MAQTQEQVTLDDVLELASRLSPVDKVRLIERLAPAIERALPDQPRTPKRSSLGALKDLGPAPSAEDIEEVRREMWANFPREDI